MTLLPSSLRPATSTSPGACTLAADMDVDEIGLSWHRCGAEDHVPCGVGPDKAGCDRTPCSGSKGIHPRKYKIRVSKMYELSSSHAMWDMSRDMAGFETVADFPMMSPRSATRSFWTGAGTSSLFLSVSSYAW
jgi:hypothetical protein